MNILCVGMNVVCIDDAGWPEPDILPNTPVRDCAYIIRNVGINPDGGIGVRVYELVNPPIRTKWGNISEPGFSAWRFRPAIGCSLFRTDAVPLNARRFKDPVDQSAYANHSRQEFRLATLIDRLTSPCAIVSPQ